MLTEQEQAKLEQIKIMVEAGMADDVPREDKQWVIQVAHREGGLDEDTIAQARAEGYDVRDIKINMRTGRTGFLRRSRRP